MTTLEEQLDAARVKLEGEKALDITSARAQARAAASIIAAIDQVGAFVEANERAHERRVNRERAEREAKEAKEAADAAARNEQMRVALAIEKERADLSAEATALGLTSEAPIAPRAKRG